MKRLNETFTDAEFEQLKQTKGDRTWHDAIIEEFLVDRNE